MTDGITASNTAAKPIAYEDMRPARVEGTHVDAPDGDARDLQHFKDDALVAVMKMSERAIAVRDQHRQQIDALKEALRLRDKHIERLSARVRELEANEPPAPWAATPKHNDQEAP